MERSTGGDDSSKPFHKLPYIPLIRPLPRTPTGVREAKFQPLSSLVLPSPFLTSFVCVRKRSFITAGRNRSRACNYYSIDTPCLLIGCYLVFSPSLFSLNLCPTTSLTFFLRAGSRRLWWQQARDWYRLINFDVEINCFNYYERLSHRLDDGEHFKLWIPAGFNFTTGVEKICLLHGDTEFFSAETWDNSHRLWVYNVLY